MAMAMGTVLLYQLVCSHKLLSVCNVRMTLVWGLAKHVHLQKAVDLSVRIKNCQLD